MTFNRLSGKIIAAGLFALLAGSATAAINIIPLPSTLTPGTGTLTIAATDVVSIYRDPASDSTVPWVEKLFKNAKISTVHATAAAGAKVVITMAADGTLGLEGYKLSITATQIVINAPTLTGQFYAVQSLRQLFPAAVEDSTSTAKVSVALPVLEISDKPRFEYRGTMIDPVRKWCPIPYVYQHIDRMALYKMNRLHLLVSNDQGFRIESKVYPLLNSVGSQTNCGGAHPPAGERWYYTQDEMRAIVKYASDRKIKIIPEIDMPGHCTAMCVAYPNLGTPNGSVQTSEDVGLSIMNTTGAQVDYVNTFIGKLWREMATIFTSDQYQIGGDECVNITAANFKAFALRLQDTLTNIGKKAIAWDEVGAAGGLRTTSWSQDWHAGSSAGQIMSSCTYLYFDMANKTGDASTNNWCISQISLQGVYGTKFTNTGLKGVEATLFSERVNIYPDYWDRQLWPRSTALAEIGWSASNNDVNGFVGRAGTHGPRLDMMGIKFYNTAGVTWDPATLNNKMTNLYDHFSPTIVADGIVSAPHNAKHGSKLMINPGDKVYDSNGRLVRLTNSGYPVSLGLVKPQ